MASIPREMTDAQITMAALATLLRLAGGDSAIIISLYERAGLGCQHEYINRYEFGDCYWSYCKICKEDRDPALVNRNRVTG